MSLKYVCLILAIFASNASAHFGILPHHKGGDTPGAVGGFGILPHHKGDDTPGAVGGTPSGTTGGENDGEAEIQEVESDEDTVIIQVDDSPDIQSGIEQIARKPLLLKALGSTRIQQPNLVVVPVGGVVSGQGGIYSGYRQFGYSGFNSAGAFYPGYQGLSPYRFIRRGRPIVTEELIKIDINIPAAKTADDENVKETHIKSKGTTENNSIVQSLQHQLKKQNQEIQKQKKQIEKLKVQLQKEKEKLQKQKEEIQKQKDQIQKQKEQIQKQKEQIQKQKDQIQKQKQQLEKEQNQPNEKQEQPGYIKPAKKVSVKKTSQNKKTVEENEENSQVNYTHEKKTSGEGKTYESDSLNEEQNEKSMNTEELNKHQMELKKQVF